jgi:hypothetical protein
MNARTWLARDGEKDLEDFIAIFTKMDGVEDVTMRGEMAPAKY